MLYHIDKHYFVVFDCDTGKQIENVNWANDSTGQYEVNMPDPNGRLRPKIRRGRIRIFRLLSEGEEP
jgi:hypothetical protein